MKDSSLQLSCQLFWARLIRETARGRIRWRRGAATGLFIGVTNGRTLRLSHADEDGVPAFKVETVNFDGQVEMELTSIGDGPHLAQALFGFARATVLYREQKLPSLLEERKHDVSDCIGPSV